MGGEKGPEGAPSPLTRLVPIKLRVEVQFRVKGHLDLISHHQPLVGDGLTQVLGQGSSKAQARSRDGERWAAALHSWLAPCMVEVGRVLGSDLFWTRTLVYTELSTPEWYSSGGMTPGHISTRWYSVQGLRDLPLMPVASVGLAASGAGDHMLN